MDTKAVIFDLDGTILNSLPLIHLTFQEVFREMGLPWGNGEVLKTVGLPLREVAAAYAPGRAEEFLERYASFQKERQEKMLKAYPGTREALQTLRDRGYRLALATSKRRLATEAGLSISGLSRYLEVVVTVDDVAKPKPEPDILYKTLELLGLDNSQAVYVGDSWYDIMTGKNAAVTTIGVTWGMASREELYRYTPSYIVDTWEELLALL